MIPLRDENPTRTVPYVVYLIIAVNIIAYLIDISGSMVVPQGVRINGLFNYTMIPAQIVRDDPTIDAKLGPNIDIPHPSPSPVWITVLTSMFLHGGLLHIAGNMLYLWIFGNNIEDVLGHFKFLLFYLAGGVIAALAHIASNPMSQIPTVGASGAIAAVLGAYLIVYPNSRVITLIVLGFFVTTAAVPAVFILGYWIFLQVIQATVFHGGSMSGGGVAYWAHIGGFVAGVIGILLFGGRRLAGDRRNERSFRNSWYED